MKVGKAEIVCTGSELLSGKLNLYVPLFHERLSPLGFKITREQSSGDSLPDIADCLSGALRRADLVIACGGLGPTFDDLTRQAAAKALGRRLVGSKACAQILALNFGLEKLPPNLKDQAVIVEGAKALENANGTAFGEVITQEHKMLALLPGPRNEWEPMFGSFLNAEIKDFFRRAPLTQAKLRLAGLGEPKAEALLKPAMRKAPALRYTILAGAGLVDFIISGPGPAAVKRAAARCAKAAGPAFYGEGDLTLAQAAGEKLLARKRTLAAAESCTGGLVAKLATDIPGSSRWFLGGAVTYSNAAKVRLLGVKPATLKKHGAVSGECAAEMAAGARKTFGSDYALAVTGIAGPDGGTPDKPAGLVWFALAGPRGTRVLRREFRGGRDYVRARAAVFILDELRKIIK